MFDTLLKILTQTIHLFTIYMPYSLIVGALAGYILYRTFIILRLYLTALNPFAGKITRVVRCADGDTIIVGNPKNKKKRQKVRLIGVDTPESLRSLYQDVMPFGKEASEYTKKRLKKGRRIFLYYDKESQDKFGRTLAYVYLSNGEFFNATLMKKGYAFAYRYPPNVKYANHFKMLEKKAKKQEKGIWEIYEERGKLKEQYKKTRHYKKFKKEHS